VVFDAALLEAPIVRADPALAAVLRRHAEDLLAALPDVTSAAALVRRHLGETLASQPPDVARAAKALGMSARSLQRKLEEEGTSFKAVVDEARRALAITHLRDERRSITDVAFLVGFSETSAFSRAFRRWTGKSPIDWRREQT
jgi:AraC-like DNA-binding protein